MKSFPKMCFEPGSKPGCWAACGVSTRHVSPSHQNLVPGSGSVQSTLFCAGGGDDLHLSPAISPWLCCSHLAPSDVLEVAPCFLCPCAGLWGRVPPHRPFAFRAQLVPLRAVVPVLLNLAGPAEGTAQQQAEASEEWGLPGVGSGQLFTHYYQE